MKGQDYDDENLRRYLLGSLTEGKTEQLDELSFTDDEMAARLQVIENDLIDAYVRGELSGKTLAQFESFYLASPKRREKVSFAQTLLVFEERTASAQATDAHETTVAAHPRSSEDSSERVSPWRAFVVPRLALQWGFAAAALVLLLAGGYLVVENLRLRDQMTQARAERNTLEQRERELQRQLTEQRSSDAETEKELAQVRERLAEIEHQLAGQQREPKIVALNLSPQSRGIGQPATLSVPAGIDYVELTLALEQYGFPAYRAALRNPAADQIIWQSAKLRAGGKTRTVRIKLPASLLNQQNYLVELSGISPSGAAEIVSSYPFRVVRQ